MNRKILNMSLLFLLSAYFTINAYADTTVTELSLDKNEYTGLGDRIKITFNSPDLNIHENTAEHLELQVYTSEDPKGFYTYIQETEDDSGIFTGYLLFSLDKANPKQRTIKVRSGVKIYIRYKDLVEETTWTPEDTEVKFDKSSFGGYGDRPLVTLTDNDLNLDIHNKEEVYVNVNSTSDAKGIKLKLVEKAPDSGVFTGEFGFDKVKSDEAEKKLLISYSDTITVSYVDDTCASGQTELRTYSSVWKPVTGTVKFNKSKYIGLHSVATVTINDQDLNQQSNNKDTARVRITSNADKKGFIVLAVETGVDTGIFSGNFRFDSKSTDNERDSIYVNPIDTIMAAYIDETSADNTANTSTTAIADFQFSEAEIQTSAVDGSGAGNMIEIIINEADANAPNIKDRIIAKVGSGSSFDDMTIWLEETGSNTGVFKCKLYLTGNSENGRSLQVSDTDNINIKYIDTNIPNGGSNEILKTVKWKYQSVMLKLDKEAYTGYNSEAKITLTNMDLNKSKEKVDLAEVKVSTSDSNSITLKLKETSADSGEFSTSFYFGRSSNRSKGTIKAANKDTVVVSYINKNDKNDTAECSASWSPQDGEITLDRKEFKGDGAPVKITVKDWDLANDPEQKDTIKVTARAQGIARSISVTLTETGKNSGTFTGTIYINGSGDKRPSISLGKTDSLEVLYTDKETKDGAEANRTAYATWGGISEAKLTLDKATYSGYDTYMTINLNDPDQNWSTTVRDKVYVLVKAKSGKTNTEYTLTETGSNTGVFYARLKLTTEAPATSKVRVAPVDEITVTFKDKNVSISAPFKD